MKLLPQQLMRGVEMAAKSLPKDATAEEIASALTSDVVGCVPLRRTKCGRGFEPVPLASMQYDAWALASRSARDVKRHALRWAKAEAVGITFPHGGPDWVLDPDTRTLSKFVIRMDASFR
ncbi:MAG: hypothetical protein KJZ75_14000 [Hyphomonadaceae bacterium]|nr:hypothetical protein [Hyphomonadaceae bacterium]